MKQYPMTKKGVDALRATLQDLKRVKRPNVIKAIAEARAYGDLKENAEYHAAKEQQSFIEGRIKDIEGKLSMAQVIDVTKIPNQGTVIFGATAHLLNVDDNKKVTYQIVGHDEADIHLNKISVNSPIARALIGKREGDIALVQAPSGTIKYKILSVEYI